MFEIYVASLEIIPQAHRRFYIADTEHGWRLDCDISDVVAGLRSALKAERENRKGLEKRLRSIAKMTDRNSPGLTRDAEVPESNGGRSRGTG